MTEPDAALERAQKRVKELKDFYGHLIAYLAVNALLVAIDLSSSPPGVDRVLGLDWAYWPIFGWGIGVAIHAASVLIQPTRWEERKLAKLLEKERHRELGQH